MNTVLPAAPAATVASGFPLALATGAALVAVIVVVLAIAALHRRSRLNPVMGFASAAAVAAIVGSALLVGGALTQSPAAVAETVPTPPPVVVEDPDLDVDGYQLPTLWLDEFDDEDAATEK